MKLPTSVTLRTYRGGDEAKIVSVWNAGLRRDPLDQGTFFRQVLCDPNFAPDGMQVAEAGGEVVGFALAIRRRIPLNGDDLEPEQGWITALAVSPKWQSQGIGSALVAAAEAHLEARGVKSISVSPYAPNYFWPGVDKEAYPAAFKLFGARGYHVLYSPVAMDKNLVGYSIPDDIVELQREREKEGYAFHPLTPAVLVEVIGFAAEHFNPDWARAIRRAALGGVPFDQFLIARDPSESVVGFALYGGYGGIQERFGPFGVSESQRGKGLGKILLYQALLGMRSKGLHTAWFLWTGEETPAGHLYHRAAFEVTRTFHVMRKEF